MEGSWNKGLLNGRDIRVPMNMEVFPRGYCADAKKSLEFVMEAKKGVFKGPCTIHLDGKKVCHNSHFYDSVELINDWNHPVGRTNHITTDNAAINCLFNLLFLIFFSLAIVEWMHCGTTRNLYFLIAAIFYLAQVIETLVSNTYSLLYHRSQIKDFRLFM